MTADQSGNLTSSMVDIDIEPVIGKKGDYIAHAVPPPELTDDQLEQPDAPRADA